VKADLQREAPEGNEEEAAEKDAKRLYL